MPRSFPQRSTLTRRDRVVVRSLAEAMFSEDGEVEGPRLDAHVSEVDAFVSAASNTTRFGLRLALLVVRLVPILFFFRFTTIERLPLAERVTLLRRLEASSWSTLSLAFIGWRTVMTLVFYEDPSELRAIGYAGHERQRYKRGLPVLGPVPAPFESGVRLREDVPSVELPTASAADEDEKEVA